MIKRKLDSTFKKTTDLTKGYLNKFLSKKSNLLMVALIIIIIIILANKFSKIFFIVGLTAIAAFSMIYNRYIKTSLGIELCMMATVLCGAKYGSLAGVVVGAVSITLAEIIGSGFQYKTLISILTLPFIGFLAGLFQNTPISTLGIILTIVYDLIILPLYMLMGSRIWRVITFLLSHLIFNYYVFTTIVPFIYRIM